MIQNNMCYEYLNEYINSFNIEYTTRPTEHNFIGRGKINLCDEAKDFK